MIDRTARVDQTAQVDRTARLDRTARVDRSALRVSRRAVLRAGFGALALASLPSIAACGSLPAPRRSDSGLRPLSVELAREQVALSSVPDLAAVIAGVRRFNAELYRAKASMADNFTVSPFSIAMAFGMLRAGCRGTTAQEIDRTFGFPAGSAPEGSVHPALNALTAALVTTGPVGTAPGPTPSGQVAPAPIVAIANGLFVDQGFASTVSRQFLKTLATQYGASPAGVSFADSASAAAVINAWVASQTRDRITKLFDRLDPSTVLVLANAVYLKATWLNQFKPEGTVDGPFSRPSGPPVATRLMRQELDAVRYAAGDGWQRVSLPYVGDELTMRVVVPVRVASDVASLAPAMAAATQPSIDDPPTWVDLTLPRWDTATELPLAPVLSKLGMPEVFSAKADLSGIAAGLFVNDAIHRANITVDEQGSEAAAVTGISVITSARVGEPITVRADRPFAWAVVHEPTGTPLFAGHVTNPAAATPR